MTDRTACGAQGAPIERPHGRTDTDAYRALSESGPTVIAGDSAGARLALVTALAARQRGLPSPVALVLFSPWIELSDITDPPSDPMIAAARLRACADRCIANDAATLASPLRADLCGLAPTLIQTGGAELLRRDAERIHRALQQAGIAVRHEIIPARWHAFQLHAGMLPSADAALVRAAQFVATNLTR